MMAAMQLLIYFLINTAQFSHIFKQKNTAFSIHALLLWYSTTSTNNKTTTTTTATVV
jgi:hypothetical protein